MVQKLKNIGKILIIDDDDDIISFMTTVLSSEGYQVESSKAGAEGYGKIESWRPDLVLLDVSIPDLDGLEILKKIRQNIENTSVILLTAKSDAKDIVHGLDMGADDYVCKPFLSEELLARVRTQIHSKKLYDQLQEANKKLNTLVERDDLTDLYNMRYLYSKLENELQRARRFQRSVCVVMLDMDHFKLVNDDHDHLFGSFVLTEMGKIIKQSIRSIDFAARYGGDEFLIVLTEVNPDGARLFCERLRKAVAENHFVNGDDDIWLTCSIGFMVTNPHGKGSEDARDIVRLADHALYRAKNDGRNRIKGVDESELSEGDFKKIEEKNEKRWRKFG